MSTEIRLNNKVSYTVTSGPSRDRLFDCMKYARDADTKIEATFTLYDDLEYVIELEVAVVIDSLRHVGVDGHIFAIDSSLADGSGVSLVINEYDTRSRTGKGVSMYE